MPAMRAFPISMGVSGKHCDQGGNIGKQQWFTEVNKPQGQKTTQSGTPLKAIERKTEKQKQYSLDRSKKLNI